MVEGLGRRRQEDVRQRLTTRREDVRRFEQGLQQAAEQLRSLEGERAALDGELASFPAASNSGHSPR